MYEGVIKCTYDYTASDCQHLDEYSLSIHILQKVTSGTKGALLGVVKDGTFTGTNMWSSLYHALSFPLMQCAIQLDYYMIIYNVTGNKNMFVGCFVINSRHSIL